MSRTQKAKYQPAPVSEGQKAPRAEYDMLTVTVASEKPTKTARISFPKSKPLHSSTSGMVRGEIPRPGNRGDLPHETPGVDSTRKPMTQIIAASCAKEGRGEAGRHGTAQMQEKRAGGSIDNGAGQFRVNT